MERIAYDSVMKFLLLFLLLFIGSLEVNGAEGSRKSFGKLLVNVIGKFDTAISLHGNVKTFIEILYPSGDDADESKAIREDLGVIKNELHDMNKHLSAGMNKIYDILKESSLNKEILEMKKMLLVGIQRVDVAWNEILGYKGGSKEIVKGTKVEILRKLVELYLEKIHHFLEIQSQISPTADVDDSDVQSLPVLIAQRVTKHSREICGTRASLQQYLLSLFMKIVKAEVKATVLSIFLEGVNYKTGNVSLARRKSLLQQFKDRYNAYFYQFSKAFGIASREFRSCDPRNGWVKGDSYFELDKFNQVTMFRAPRDWFWIWSTTCPVRAPQLKGNATMCRDSSNLVDCWDDELEICHGNLESCTAISYANRCLQRHDTRRYGWIKANSPYQVFGREQDGCDKNNLIEENSRYYCLCDCIEPRNRVSLELSMSDVRKRRVVTAIRLAKVDSTVFIQIKEGKLGPNGTIEKQFDKWIPSSPTTDPKKLMPFDRIENAFNTDTLVGRHNDVLTGIGFTRSTESSGKRLKLQIHVERFQYTTGRILGRRLNITSSTKANDLHVIGDIPSLYDTSGHEHEEDSLPGHYERFYRSSLAADAGQTTIPLFDSVPVEGDPPTPLSGAGLIHKGTGKYAGFLSLKAITVDYAHYFRKFYGMKARKTMSILEI